MEGCCFCLLESCVLWCLVVSCGEFVLHSVLRKEENFPEDQGVPENDLFSLINIESKPTIAPQQHNGGWVMIQKAEQ
jgi:hypothetical protein